MENCSNVFHAFISLDYFMKSSVTTKAVNCFALSWHCFVLQFAHFWLNVVIEIDAYFWHNTETYIWNFQFFVDDIFSFIFFHWLTYCRPSNLFNRMGQTRFYRIVLKKKKKVLSQYFFRWHWPGKGDWSAVNEGHYNLG